MMVSRAEREERGDERDIAGGAGTSTDPNLLPPSAPTIAENGSKATQQESNETIMTAIQKDENITSGGGSSSSGSSSNSSNNSTNDEKRIYIMTLGVLAAYRGRTIGTQLIQSILDYFEENKDKAESPDLKDVTEISLHVQISNDDAIKFYTEKFGFEKGEMVENYYRRIDPPHCYKLYKKLR